MMLLLVRGGVLAAIQVRFTCEDSRYQSPVKDNAASRAGRIRITV